jgi:CDP-diacylglycerol--glycerol-3-phosphate 3-phosphatidyltransferase
VAGTRLTLPNVITFGRIVVCPVIFFLALAPGVGSRFAAFVLFVAAGLSDVWDGYLARKHGWITDMGKLLDPLADKLLLLATWIPFFIISHRGVEAGELPFLGPMPVWILVVILGRELFITVFRSWAARQGVVIAAGGAGKQKALFQSLFAGGLLLWYPLLAVAADRGWSGALWTGWSLFHRVFVAVTLGVAVVLTVYSMLDYLWRYRSLLGVRT